MKKTKKLLACLIAAATMFTMGSTAFAAEADATPVDQETVTIHKQYKLIGEGTSPEETFTLDRNFNVGLARIHQIAGYSDHIWLLFFNKRDNITVVFPKMCVV